MRERESSRTRRRAAIRALCIACAAALLAGLSGCGSAPPTGGAGYYTVRRGDTLSRIAQRNGRSVGELSRWNNLRDADHIQVGQLLRISPPGARSASTTRGASEARGTPPTAANRSTPPTAAQPTPPTAPPALIWPARGPLVGRFDGAGNKGVDIGGSTGTPVVAAAAGTVVYAGDSLRGYGNLLIVKHNADYLTSYAHNRVLLAKEGDAVAQGQKIAEMGDTDSSRVMLHFELRYRGRSIDPLRYLPGS